MCGLLMDYNYYFQKLKTASDLDDIDTDKRIIEDER